MSGQHWAETKERGSYWGIRILLAFYKHGGKWLVQAGLIPVMIYFFLTAKASRRESLNYLQQNYNFHGPTQALPSKPNWFTSFRHFWQFSQSAVHKIDAWVGKLSIDDLQLGNVEKFHRQVKQGKGALLIASHLGNVEVCRALVRQHFPIRMNVIVFTAHAEKFNRVLKDLNSDAEMDLIQAKGITPDLVIMLKHRVEHGECVVIVGDRVAVDSPGNVVWADFLGKPAPFAMGPWILASVLECPVYLMSCMRQVDNYQLNIEYLAEQIKIPPRKRLEELEYWLPLYAEHLNELSKEYPLQWYNFYNFWTSPQTNNKKD